MFDPWVFIQSHLPVSGGRVLVAPLDWGLGHATRCVPIIRELIRLNCHVVLAGNGPSLTLLREEFSSLPCIEVAGYSPVYARTSSLVRKLSTQLIKFRKAITDEHRQTVEIVRQHNIGLIISDNRYGCWSKEARSIFVCHQVNLLLSKSMSWLEPTVNRIHRSYIRSFDHCWIPDHEGKDALGGVLSSSDGLDATYVGPLSRFQPSQPLEKEFDLTFVLSGPEPQRSMLEEDVIRKTRGMKERMCLVRGILKGTAISSRENLSVFDFMNSEDLQRVMARSKFLVMRSGYSTIMDLTSCGGNVFFVPTPGQTEQQYLARRFEMKGIAGFAEQHAFDPRHALAQAVKYRGFAGSVNDHFLLRAALRKVTQDI